MDYEESLQYMGGLIRFGWKLGNERIEALAERLGNPHRNYHVVHVAGTKGKGSTTAMSAAILRAHGLSVGGYYSPYVYDVRERIQVDGEPIPKADFARLVTRVRPHIEALAETDLGQTTEFELKTIIAFLYFAQRKVEYACVEVGIGGRMDATNIVAPRVTVITNIGLDHTEILGDTHAKIAVEKAGIIKEGVPCITATANPEALATIERIAAERQSPLIRVLRGAGSVPTGDPACVYWEPALDHKEFGPVSVATSRRVYSGLAMRMGGLYQRENAACAIAAVEHALAADHVDLRLGAVCTALAETALPGRLTVVRLDHGPLVVLDGAHNLLAAEALSRTIAALCRSEGIQQTRLVIGMVGGHSPDGVLAALAPGVERVIACQPNWRRAQLAEAIAEAAAPYCRNIRVVHAVPLAIESALAGAGPDTLILVTGSFYTVGEAPRELRG